MGQDLGECGMKALARLGGPGIAALASYLEAKDERLRRRCAQVLAAIESDAARAVLARALSDDSPSVRLAAARGLAAADAAYPRLAALLADADAEVRATVVRLCGRRFPKRPARASSKPSTIRSGSKGGVWPSRPSESYTVATARRPPGRGCFACARRQPRALVSGRASGGGLAVSAGEEGMERDPA